MNRLEEFFFTEPKKHAIHKWKHYFKIYEKHLHAFLHKNPIIVEIGIYKGGSIDMWNKYFDNKCTIIAIDNNPECKSLQQDYEENVHIVIGDQADPVFWDDFLQKYPSFDIVLDDGGHRMEEQIITFEKLYPYLNNNGVYLCEDTHTSYLTAFGGGYLQKNTFIEYSKNFIDLLHAYFIEGLSLDFRKNTFCISYYDSIVVFDKWIDTEHPTDPLME